MAAAVLAWMCRKASTPVLPYGFYHEPNRV